MPSKKPVFKTTASFLKLRVTDFVDCLNVINKVILYLIWSPWFGAGGINSFSCVPLFYFSLVQFLSVIFVAHVFVRFVCKFTIFLVFKVTNTIAPFS